jgi:hypothetical protein
MQLRSEVRDHPAGRGRFAGAGAGGGSVGGFLPRGGIPDRWACGLRAASYDRRELVELVSSWPLQYAALLEATAAYARGEDPVRRRLRPACWSALEHSAHVVAQLLARGVHEGCHHLWALREDLDLDGPLPLEHLLPPARRGSSA